MFSWTTDQLDRRTTRCCLRREAAWVSWREFTAWLCADDPALRRSLTAQRRLNQGAALVFAALAARLALAQR